MKKKFETIVRFLTDLCGDQSSLSRTHPASINQDAASDAEIAGNLNAAFLILLSGPRHASYDEARAYFDNYAENPVWGRHVGFYREGHAFILNEIEHACSRNQAFMEAFTGLFTAISEDTLPAGTQEAVEEVGKLFFPERVGICSDRKSKINALRELRTVRIEQLNPSPVTDPAREMLFTSNVLITVPFDSGAIDGLNINSSTKDPLKAIVQEDQQYWYDHPIPVGIPPENNEILYGLQGLDEAVEIEKQRGIIANESRVTCLLSVSVTHKGLQSIAKAYIEEELKKHCTIRHLDLYVFTEADTERLLTEGLLPMIGDKNKGSALGTVFGVDGEYGRHYTFLKAIAAFWQVFINPDLKATFKIDLDQVFPQHELIEQGGCSAMEHFTTPLWGASGIDSDGRRVELGMLAGALVNQKDIGSSLFTPDVCFPPDQLKADELVFFSALPQALSTEAEMMTRYGQGDIDGERICIQRIHVTGGTNGILIEALRKHRPFTPSFIGRAEDQAYILSVLFDGSNGMLRYLHKDGLIMRHDKEAFAAEAMKMAATGKVIGDYVRTLMFSYYARALPWSVDQIKESIDPFTGCFVSRIPLTVVYLRFALKAAAFFDGNRQERQGLDFLRNGISRIGRTVHYLTENPNPLIDLYDKEKQGWHAYYDLLDSVEARINENDPAALDLRTKARTLISACRVAV